MPDEQAKQQLNEGGDRSAETSREFVRLLTANQHRVYAFILTLVPDWSVAEDILQDTSEVMWVKYAQVRPVTDFTAWAIRIAHNKVLNYLTKKTNTRVLFSSELLEEVAQRAELACGQMDERLAALRQCVAKLSDFDRSLIRLRYENNQTIKQIAQEAGRPIHGMYKRMMRIHEALIRCIRYRMTMEASHES